MPGALRRKLSSSLDGKIVTGKEEILEGSGALNYALDIKEGNEGS